MTNVDHRSLPCSVQIFFAVRCGNPAAFTGDSKGISFLEIARKERSMIRHGVPILAELRQPLRQLVNRFKQVAAAALHDRVQAFNHILLEIRSTAVGRERGSILILLVEKKLARIFR